MIQFSAVSKKYGDNYALENLDLEIPDGEFVFLIGHYMEKLDKFIDGQPHKKLRVVSHAFEIPGKKPIKKRGALFLYEYPANLKKK